MLSIIVAKSRNNAIGKDNKLLWKIPDDLKRFKTLTTGHVIIMGRKTFESLGRVLPNRLHIVLTRDENYKVENENVKIVNHISEIDPFIKDNNENFIIGGAQIYATFLSKCQKLYITQIDKDFIGDSYFPKIKEEEWNLIEQTKGPKDDNDFGYEYLTYERKKV